ncbi:MAG: shikimate dehydrogenase [Candidatus Limnocylindrales bacterium]
MSVVLLLGHPVAHSLSPRMQNAAFTALGLGHRYETLDVTSEDLPAAIDRIRTDAGVLGANVTVPHKEAVMRLVETHDGEAARAGAANTISKRADPAGGARLQGWNTDGLGFDRSLREAGITVAAQRVLVLGAGGAARAVVPVLVRGLAQVTIANRDRSRAERLANGFPTAGGAWRPAVVDWSTSWSVAGADIVVNATPLGLQGEDPLAGVPLPSRLVVIDLVPTATDTPLVARARAAGCDVLNGLPMLVQQAALAFTIWTNQPPPLGAMRSAIGLS